MASAIPSPASWPASAQQVQGSPTTMTLSLPSEDSAFPITKLPTELISSILSHLIDHKPTLFSCALAGHILLAPARMHLFHTVVIILASRTPRGALNPVATATVLHSFAAFVTSTPAVACFVRDLTIRSRAHSPQNSAPLVPLPLLGQIVDGLKGLRVLRVHDSFWSSRPSAGVSTNTGGETQEKEEDERDIAHSRRMVGVRALYVTMPLWNRSSTYIYDILPWFPRLETLHLRGGTFSPDRFTDLDPHQLVPPSLRLKDLSLILPRSSLHLLSLLQGSPTVHRLEALTVLIESVTDAQILDAFVRANDIGSSVRRLSVRTGEMGLSYGRKSLGTETFLPLQSTLATCPSMQSFSIWADTIPFINHLLPVLTHPHVEEVTFVLVGTLPRLEQTFRGVINWGQLEATLINGFPQLARFRFAQQQSGWVEEWEPLEERVRGWVRNELGAMDVAGMLCFD